jgi:hypothetical protein
MMTNYIITITNPLTINHHYEPLMDSQFYPEFGEKGGAMGT